MQDTVINPRSFSKRIREKLPVIFAQNQLEAEIHELLSKEPDWQSHIADLNSQINSVPIKWNKPGQGSYFSFEKKPPFFSLIEGLNLAKGYFLSHGSSLWIRGPVDKIPETLFLTREVPGKWSHRSEVVTEKDVESAFRKPPRNSNNFLSYQGKKIFLLEKIKMGQEGVQKSKLEFDGRTYYLHSTGPERTLIDSLIAPHYMRSLKDLIRFAQGYDFSVEKLFRYYKLLNPVYPYWQSVGFLLNFVGKRKAASTWEAKFGDRAKIKFYLARELQKPNYDAHWKIYYPSGLSQFVGQKFAY